MLTVEERVQTLEQEVAGLKAALRSSKPAPRDWESTVGAFEDDPLFLEAMKLGKEYRDSQPVADEGENS